MERRKMEHVRMNLEAIRAQMKKTRSEMANMMGISVDRYNRLANGESKMLASELIKLNEISGIPFENIDVPNA